MAFIIPTCPRGATLADWLARRDPAKPTVGILFYRSHWMSGNLAFIDALVRAIEARGGQALPVFTSSLKDCVSTVGAGSVSDGRGVTRPVAYASGSEQRPIESRWPAAFDFLMERAEAEPTAESRVHVLIATLSFAMGEVNPDGPTPGGWSVEALETLGVPVVQAICGSTAPGSGRHRRAGSIRSTRP